MGEQLDYDPRSVVERLLDGWDNSLTDLRPDLSRWRPEEVLLVWGYAAHTHTMARAALILHDNSVGAAAMPCLRLAFECSLTAQWVTQVADSVHAVVMRHDRQLGKLAKSIVESGFDFVSDSHRERAAAEVLKLPTTSANAAQRFEALCDDLDPAGKVAYAHYRALSAYSHASAFIADDYAVEDESAPGDMTINTKSRKTQLGWADLSLLAATLVWAARAFDYMDRNRTRRSELQGTARLLGIAPVLKPSEKVVLRRATRRTKH